MPDVAQLGLPGVNAEMIRQAGAGGRGAGSLGSSMGVGGLKQLGVRDLTYKTAFLACMSQSSDTKVDMPSGPIRSSLAEPMLMILHLGWIDKHSRRGRRKRGS